MHGFIRRIKTAGRGQAAITLVEAIVACAILAIAAVTMVTAFYTVGRINLSATQTNADDEQNAADIAESNYTDKTDGSGTLTFSDGTTIQGTTHTLTGPHNNEFKTFTPS